MRNYNTLFCVIRLMKKPIPFKTYEIIAQKS